MRLAGFIALSDPRESDSAGLVTQLRALGVRTIMVTGDAPATAAIVATQWAWTGRPVHPVRYGRATSGDFRVFAAFSPKTSIVLFRNSRRAATPLACAGRGQRCPALRQAQMGIAVSTATDVAKSAAGIVLTEAGLVASSVGERGRTISSES